MYVGEVYLLTWLLTYCIAVTKFVRYLRVHFGLRFTLIFVVNFEL